MKKVTAECPGSCGELIQGYLKNRKMLVSYPVSLYSRVTVTRGKPVGGYPKIARALRETLLFLGLWEEYGGKLGCRVESRLPVGKGMASSTADIGAAVAATAAFCGRELSPDEIAGIALAVEPTDSVLFESLTLFDHLKGEYKEEIGKCPPLDVVVLEGYGTVDTRQFNQEDHTSLLYAREGLLQEAYNLLCRGVQKGDSEAIGQAAMISSRANQAILPKKGLEEIIEACLMMEALGVNVAHSGTVLGVLVEPGRGDTERIAAFFRQAKWHSFFERVYVTKTVDGGTRLV